MDKQKKVFQIKTNLLLNDYFKVEEAFLRVEKFDGTFSKEFRRLNFIREDACCALLYNKIKNAVLLVKQFRYPSFTKGEGFILEVPAGIIEKDEEPETTIIREVLEETGFQITNPSLIYRFFPSPGISSERCFLFFTEILDSDKRNNGGGLASENEDIQTKWIPRNQILSYLSNGEIKDAKTIIALQWFLISGF
jgi:nudix-type nucleoside diphosphatase (YffH/AdpP family)